MEEAWTDLEIDLIVADYFAMLIEELAGRPFNKAEHNRALQALLKDSARNRGSIKFKPKLNSCGGTKVVQIA